MEPRARCLRITPPEQGPPTPPAIEERHRLESEAVRRLHSYRRLAQTGGLGPWTEFELSPPLFNKLRDTIVRSFRRFDYEPGKGRLAIRMPTVIHEYFISFLRKHISNWIDGIARQEGRVGIFASKIASGDSSDTFLDDDGSSAMEIKREPDGQFQHLDTAFPGVVIEVSYSQDGKKLRKLAQDYILGSDGNIKAVIGINIKYRGTEESTVSLWRPRFGLDQVLEAEQVVSYQPFRPAADPNRCLTLRLSDFAPDEMSAGYESVSLSIPFARLAQFLDQAEMRVQTRRLHRDLMASKPRVRKRRQSSSADELGSEDEAKLAARENAV